MLEYEKEQSDDIKIIVTQSDSTDKDEINQGSSQKEGNVVSIGSGVPAPVADNENESVQISTKYLHSPCSPEREKSFQNNVLQGISSPASMSSSTAFDDSCWQSFDSDDKKRQERPGTRRVLPYLSSLDTENNYNPDVALSKLQYRKYNSNENSPVSSNHDIQSSNEIPQQDHCMIKWSHELVTPSKGDFCSPSKDINKSTSLHGYGLIMTFERSKQVFKCQTRFSKFLLSVADLHDNLAQSVLKSCQNHVNSMDTGASRAIAIKTILDRVLASVTSFGKQTQGIAIAMKGSIARPMGDNANKILETLPSIYENYTSSRDQCLKARNKALKQKNRYTKVVKEAEFAIKDLEKAKLYVDKNRANNTARLASQSSSSLPESDSTLSASSHDRNKTSSRLSKKSERVLQAIRNVQQNEEEYCSLVNRENEAVYRSNITEIETLESLQKIEEDRLNFLIESFLRLLHVEIKGLDKLMVESHVSEEKNAMNGDISPPIKKRDPTAPFTPVPSPSSLFSKLKLQADEGSGEAEATTLNLSSDVGKLRDKTKVNLVAIGQRSNAVKFVSAFIEELASAVDDFSSGLVSKLAGEGYTTQGSKNENAIAVSTSQTEGPKALGFWTEIIDTLIECSQAASELSKTMRAKNHDYLDEILLRSEKDLKLIVDCEEARWKLVCDTAKSEIRARQRVEQVIADLVKAKERLDVHTEDAANDQDAGDKLNPAMRKALGNMFSILPNKGEEAMSKMFHPKARQAIAKTTYDDTETRLEKENQIYKTIQTELKNVISSYTAAAKALQMNFNQEEKRIWGKIEDNFDNVLDSLRCFRYARFACLKPVIALLEDYDINMITLDMKEWSLNVREKFFDQIDAINKTDANKTFEENGNAKDINDFTGTSLSPELIQSPRVYGLISLIDGNKNDGEDVDGQSDKHIQTEDSDTKTKTVATDNQKDTPGSPNIRKSSRPNSSNNINELANDYKEFERKISKSISLISNASEDPPLVDLASIASMLKESIENERNGEDSTSSKKEDSDKTNDSSLPKASNAELDIFLQHFKDDESTEPPSLLESYSCAYHPKEDAGMPYYLLHGRMFATSSAMYFVGWGETKVIVQWKDVVSVTKEANVMGVVNNSIRIIANHGDGDKSYYFGSFAYRENCFQLINRLVAVTKSIVELTVPEEKKNEDEQKDEKAELLPPVPPDVTLKKMEVVVNKKIRNTSIQNFYDTCIAETSGPFYGPCLEDDGNQEVSVGEWETNSDEFLKEWCGEKYSKKRVSTHTSRFFYYCFQLVFQFINIYIHSSELQVITFKFTRKTHLYIGPPIASVTQTQHCRIEGNDKCISSINVAMQGIPYSDAFNVEVRWVARRVGKNDIQVESGLFVDFKKPTM